MLDNWIVIYSTVQLYEAELVKSIMAENDIESVIMNQRDSTYGFGEIEVYVPTSEAFRAKQLILNIQGE
jgi:hypothetical protein